MSYCQGSGSPWILSEMWFQALSGGKLNMRMLTTPAHASELSLLGSRDLSHPSMRDFGNPLNPSIVLFEGRRIVSVRVCSKEQKTTHNFFYINDGGPHLLRDASGAGPFEYGYEDLRLFVWDGKLHAIAATSTQGTAGSPRTGQTILEIDVSDMPTVTRVWRQESPRHEKNWMPCVHPEGLRLVYATDPLMVLDVDRALVERASGPKSEVVSVRPRVADLPGLDAILRGGSQLVPYKGGWLAVVHQIHGEAGSLEKAIYVHRFAAFDADLRSVKVSEPFYVKHVGIEFVSGLARGDGCWQLTVGVADKEAWLCDVSDDIVDAYVSGAVQTPKWPLKPGPVGAVTAARAASAPPPATHRPSWNPCLGGFPPIDGRW